jgi:hypothetical protein
MCERTTGALLTLILKRERMEARAINAAKNITIK